MKLPDWAASIIFTALLAGHGWELSMLIEQKIATAELRVAVSNLEHKNFVSTNEKY